MCGISGFLNESCDQHSDAMAETAWNMANSIAARGPDDCGVWVDASAGIAFGFRRLAIVDRSPAGHQPMHSKSGRYVIVFNGEIYNHRDLRNAVSLDNQGLDESPNSQSSTIANNLNFRGHSDTEVLLACIEKWGFEAAIRRATGMFAIALWDRRERVLYLARDRMGEKPLYYGKIGQCFMFGSQLKAIEAHPKFSSSINRDSLRLYMMHGYIPAPLSIYEGAYKLPPGSILKVSPEHEQTLPPPKAYWSVQDAAINGQEIRGVSSAIRATDELERLLIQSITGQMSADVPVGAFLSGGIDSSIVAAIMQANSTLPIKTFTIGFEEQAFDEAKYARQVSEFLGTDHTDLYISPKEAQNVIPQIPEIYDEPFADASQIPTFLVARLAKEKVSVCLSGDGGDELFGGYSRYNAANKLWNLNCALPRWVRRLLGNALQQLPSHGVNQVGALLGPLQSFGGASTISNKLTRIAASLRCDSFQQLYGSLTANWSSAERIVLGEQRGAAPGVYPFENGHTLNAECQARLFDQLCYLPDDILAKVDRATMAVSLESRTPLLDHRIVEFSWHLPRNLIYKQGIGKYLLRQVLFKYVPRHLIERPKMGFCIPLSQWLRGPLQNWASGLLEPTRIRNDGYLDSELLDRTWAEHTSGTQNSHSNLWTALMFQAWREHAKSTRIQKCRPLRLEKMSAGNSRYGTAA